MKLMCIRCPKLLRPIVRLFAKTRREMDAFERHEPQPLPQAQTPGRKGA
jgi:hypothetical protein